MTKYLQILKAVILISFTGLSGNILAQKTITGTITDAQNEEPLIGVSILIKDSQGIGTITDIDGKFELTVPNNDAVLLLSFVGYELKEVPVGNKDVLDISLGANLQQLNEIVVTALGIKRQKREIGYSTESFDGEELVLSNAPNVVSALSGKSAGVQVTTANGVDGGTTRFTIRGNNNIDANNQPLIVVDGVPLENDPGLTNVGRGVDWGSAINNINPNDIEDINILKGPTASALYGSRGANGVVLITTKEEESRKASASVTM